MEDNERENEVVDMTSTSGPKKEEKTQSGVEKKSSEKIKETPKSKEKSEEAKEKKAERSERSKKRNKSAVWVGEKKESPVGPKSSKSKEKTPSKKSDKEEQETKTPEEKEVKESKKNKKKKDKKDKKKKDEDEEEEEDEGPGYGPQHAVRVLIPVTICIFLVIFIVMTVYLDKSVNLDGVRSRVSMVNVMKEGKDKSTGSNIWRAVVNGLIVLGVIAVMTCVLLFLYWMKWYKVLWVFLFLGMTVGFLIHNFWLLTRVFHVYSIPVSLITFVFLDVNMIIMGALTVFWKGPKLFRQGIMIFFSLTAALTMQAIFPTYTTWIVLGLLVAWDIFAVLAPCGPLKKFVELAQERDEKGNGPLSALVYTAGMAYFEDLSDMRSTGGKDEKEKSEKEEKPKKKDKKRKEKEDKKDNEKEKKEEEEEEPEEKNIQLGLGDFVFYSMLIGKASETGCWTTVFACYVTILSGLLLTLMLLMMYKKALPALPISIPFGLIFYFAGEYAMLPFQNECNRLEMVY